MRLIRHASAFALIVLLGCGDARADGVSAQADKDAANIFNSTCGWCHQGNGRVAGGIGPKLMNSPRSDEYIVNRIKSGKEGAMPAFGAQFSEAQIQALLRYIRNLKPEN